LIPVQFHTNIGARLARLVAVVNPPVNRRKDNPNKISRALTKRCYHT
jgi:hypothetical protein